MKIVLYVVVCIAILLVVCKGQSGSYDVLYDSYVYNQPKSNETTVLRSPAVTSDRASSVQDDSKQVKWAPSFPVPAGEEWRLSVVKVGTRLLGIDTIYYSFFNDSNGLPSNFNTSFFTSNFSSSTNYTLTGLAYTFNTLVNPSLVLTGGNYWLELYSVPSTNSNYFSSVQLNSTQTNRTIKQAVWCGSNITCSTYLNGQGQVLQGQNPSALQKGAWTAYNSNPSIFAFDGYKVGICCLPNFTCVQNIAPECTSLNGSYKGSINATFSCPFFSCFPSPSPSSSVSATPSVTATPSVSVTASVTPSPSSSLSQGASPSNTATASLSFGATPSNSLSFSPSPAASSVGGGSGSTLVSWIKNIM